MAAPTKKNDSISAIEVGPDDILFECPACSKSLVVDKAAEGMTVSCPQCQISLIVPPKLAAEPAPPPKAPAQPGAKKTEPQPDTRSKPKPEPVKTPAIPAEPSRPPSVSPPATTGVGASELKELQAKLTALTGKLKELQTQRTELSNRIATRLNDVNRDLVMLARLETSHQQVIAELNQLAEQLPVSVGPASEAGKSSSAGVSSGRTRVSFQV